MPVTGRKFRTAIIPDDAVHDDMLNVEIKIVTIVKKKKVGGK